MKVYIKCHDSIHGQSFVTPLVQHINIVGNTIEITFSDEVDSQYVFQRIRLLGFNCSHAGSNAPDGPMVMIHDAAKNNYKLKIV